MFNVLGMNQDCMGEAQGRIWNRDCAIVSWSWWRKGSANEKIRTGTVAEALIAFGALTKDPDCLSIEVEYLSGHARHGERRHFLRSLETGDFVEICGYPENPVDLPEALVEWMRLVFGLVSQFGPLYISKNGDLGQICLLELLADGIQELILHPTDGNEDVIGSWFHAHSDPAPLMVAGEIVGEANLWAQQALHCLSVTGEVAIKLQIPSWEPCGDRNEDYGDENCWCWLWVIQKSNGVLVIKEPRLSCAPEGDWQEIKHALV